MIVLVAVLVLMLTGYSLSFRGRYGHWPWLSCDVCR